MIETEFTNAQISYLIKNFNKEFTYQKLAGDASTRIYYRLFVENKSYILCLDENLNKISSENHSFCIVSDILKRNYILIPEILSFSEDCGIFILEDLGDLLLSSYLDTAFDNKDIIGVYTDIIDGLIGLQSIKGNKELPFSLSFDRDKLNFEFNFFIKHYIQNYLKKNLSDKDTLLLYNEFNKISEILDKPEFFVLNHRDFHSRNIIIKNKKPYFIDYQDARMGLPQYDLVSLLRDSYYTLEDDIFEKLKKYYYETSLDKNIHKFNSIDFDYYFDIMAFQRNIKALGSFGYLITSKKDERYRESIKPTINYLKKYVAKRDELKKAYSLLTDFGVFI